MAPLCQHKVSFQNQTSGPLKPERRGVRLQRWEPGKAGTCNKIPCFFLLLRESLSPLFLNGGVKKKIRAAPLLSAPVLRTWGKHCTGVYCKRLYCPRGERRWLSDLDVNLRQGDSVSWFFPASFPEGTAKNVNCCVSQKACFHTLSMRVLSLLLCSHSELWGWLPLVQGWMVSGHSWPPVSPSSLGGFG